MSEGGDEWGRREREADREREKDGGQPDGGGEFAIGRAAE